MPSGMVTISSYAEIALVHSLFSNNEDAVVASFQQLDRVCPCAYT